jgi:hypothetical protein
MDNADNNDKMTEALQVLLTEWEIDFDHQDQHI